MNGKKNDSNSLAIIGASGTGKTVLAVGLFATSTEEFTVSAVGDETRRYIEIRKTAMDDGHWPAATNQAENLDLRLRLHAGGRETDIVFREYMGERMEQPDYLERVIGTPEAAMILFNPGMPGLRNTESRNKMIDNIKAIVQHLKDHKCAAIALVVTASDRLASDLAGFRDEFETHVTEVTNHLGTLGIGWKRFDVTVSGKLADQNHPKLACGDDNTTRVPFLWLLKRIHRRKVRKLLAKTACWAAGLCLMCGAVNASLQGCNARELQRVEFEEEALIKALTEAHGTNDTARVHTNLTALVALKGKVDGIKTRGKKNQASKTNILSDLEDKCALWKVRDLELRLTDIAKHVDKQPPGWVEIFANDLQGVLQSECPEIQALRDRWEKERPGLETRWFSSMVHASTLALEKAEGNAIPQKLKEGKDLFDKSKTKTYWDEKIAAPLQEARTNALERYCRFLVDQQDDIGNAPEDPLRTNLMGKVTEDEYAWLRQKWEGLYLPKARKGLVQALCSGDGTPVLALKQSLNFLQNMTNRFGTVGTLEMDITRQAIVDARDMALEAYAQSLENSLNIKGNEQPKLDIEKIKRDLTDDAVTQEEKSAFAGAMKIRLKNAQAGWKNYQKELVDKFDMERDVKSIVRDYGEFIDDHSNNPYLDSLHGRMETKIGTYFYDYVAKYAQDFRGDARIWSRESADDSMTGVQEDFNDFKTVCLAMAGPKWSGSPLPDKAIGKFAKDCVNQGNLGDLTKGGLYTSFRQEIKITKVEVKFAASLLDETFQHLGLGISFWAQRWDFEGKRWEYTATPISFSNQLSRAQCDGSWRTLWEGTEILRVNPWHFSFLRLSIKDYLSAFFSLSVTADKNWYLDFQAGEQSKEFPWEHVALIHSDNTNTEGCICIRLTFNGTGPDFLKLWEKAMSNP